MFGMEDRDFGHRFGFEFGCGAGSHHRRPVLWLSPQRGSVAPASGSSMPTRPTAVFALAPAKTAPLFADPEMTRLRSLCSIPDEAPLESFASDRARSLLANAEILIT